ncbi:MAG: matrixin family metalloprotease, partial [bacterium]|nr:matrixin family metalloprotease [bacterium]
MRLSLRVFAAVVFLIAAQAVDAYVRSTTSSGVPLIRTDVTNIQYVVNNQTAAGMTNTDGAPIITADSDPIGTLRSAVATWNAVPTSAIRFAELQTSALVDASDNQHVIIFTDTPEHRTRTSGALAVTSNFFSSATGEISDSDITFNPTETFSTNLAENTFDLGSTAIHELGHALGAGHTIFFGATMFQSGPPASNLQATLSADDIAFANAVYPAPGQAGN